MRGQEREPRDNPEEILQRLQTSAKHLDAHAGERDAERAQRLHALLVVGERQAPYFGGRDEPLGTLLIWSQPLVLGPALPSLCAPWHQPRLIQRLHSLKSLLLQQSAKRNEP